MHITLVVVALLGAENPAGADAMLGGEETTEVGGDVEGTADGEESPESAEGEEAPQLEAAPDEVSDVDDRAARALERANRLLDDGEMVRAMSAYHTVRELFAGTPEATLAERMLRAMQWSPEPPKLAPGSANAPPSDGEKAYAVEAYSLRTRERLSINIWEKIDFVTTAFAYGMSVGGSYAAGIVATQRCCGDTTPSIITPLILSAGVYTSASILYLAFADPDRGDLPLTLAIASYIPLTVSGIGLIANADGAVTGWSNAIAGTLALPLAYLGGYLFDLDPGDTQLVRDAGFWGAAMAAGISAGISTATRRRTWPADPDGQLVVGVALAGLYSGLGLGVVGATFSEISLERVRVMTWAGYGGTGLGALVGGLATSETRDTAPIWIGMAAGAAIGLTAGFLASSSLDEIPDSANMESDTVEEVSFLTPTMLESRDARGNWVPAFGFNLATGRW